MLMLICRKANGKIFWCCRLRQGTRCWGQFVDSRELQDLFNATKTLLGRFATPGSSLATDLQLLVGLQRDMFEWRQAEGAYQWGFEQEWAAE